MMKIWLTTCGNRKSLRRCARYSARPWLGIVDLGVLIGDTATRSPQIRTEAPRRYRLGVLKSEKTHKHKKYPQNPSSLDPTLKILYAGVLFLEDKAEEAPHIKNWGSQNQKMVDDKVNLRYSCLVWLCEAKLGRFSLLFPGFAWFGHVAHLPDFPSNLWKSSETPSFGGTERFFSVRMWISRYFCGMASAIFIKLLENFELPSFCGTEPILTQKSFFLWPP